MVDAEDLVVDDALDEVKHAEAHQDRAQQQLARPSNVVGPGVAPQDPEAKHREDVGAGGEKTVSQRVHLQVLHAVERVTDAGWKALIVSPIPVHGDL
jgi:hypothetical protein